MFKKADVVICLFFLMALLFQSCSSLKTESFDSDINHKTNYNSPMSAFKSADINGLNNFKLSTDEARFKTGLEFILNHDFISAKDVFLDIYDSTAVDSVKAEAAKIIFNILFYLSEWEKIEEFDMLANPDVEDEDNIMLLAKALARTPKERIVFNNDDSTFNWTVSPSGCPIVPCMINGRLRYFWFDTGANYSVISSDIANECDVMPIIFEHSKARTSTVRKIDIYPAVADSIAIGGAVIYNSPFVIVKEDDLKLRLFGSHTRTKIDGIIGWKIIQHLDVTVDHLQHTMRIKEPVDKNIPKSEKNFFWLGCPVVKTTDSSGTPLIFGLDIGSERSSITHSIFDKIEFDNIYQKVKPLTSAGGSVYFHAKLLSRLKLFLTGYSVEFNNIGTTYQVPHLFLRLDGILGSDFIENSVINIDIRNGVFSYKPLDL